MSYSIRTLLGLSLLVVTGSGLVATEPVDLADYRTVETALTTRISTAKRDIQAQPAYLGVHVSEEEAGKLTVTAVAIDSPAARAGVQKGDLLIQVDGQDVASKDDLREILQAKEPSNAIKLMLVRQDNPLELTAILTTHSRPMRPENETVRPAGWEGRSGRSYFTRSVYRLGVVCIEYPDVKHNPKVPAKAWEDAFFSRRTYTKMSATGQPVFGSLNDYYQEQSYGQFRVEGKVFPYVEVSKKRADYATGDRWVLLREAVDKLQARDGKDVLNDFDGLVFLYAGGRFQTTRGSLYWPHRSTLLHQNKRWPYFICPEGGERMANISVFCHEFGHLLGLPDLYARPENPGSEGLSVWCAMSNQAPNGRPQHFCAWAKEKLGWLKPAIIDPTVPQKLILRPVEDSPKECFKVLIRPDGSEYLLLENRRKKGFDQSLPAEGLLIWRVIQNRPILEESHGIDGPAGPRVFASEVPYPSPANDAYTPYTTPSSRSQLGGGRPVHITNIRRLADGRITFHIGYEYQ